jgi:hypothetical protein
MKGHIEEETKVIEQKPHNLQQVHRTQLKSSLVDDPTSYVQRSIATVNLASCT